MATRLTKELSVQRLVFTNCYIDEEVAAIFVEALHGEHNFTEIDLFNDTSVNIYNRWTSYHQDYEYTGNWKKSIAAEIKKLTWSNRFKVDKDTFLHEVLGPASVKEKLDLLDRKIGVSCLAVESSSDNAKLCYRAMEAANAYDYRNKRTSDSPSMLHSLIREIPDFFLQKNVDDGAPVEPKKKEAQSVLARRVDHSLTLRRHVHYYVTSMLHPIQCSSNRLSVA
jgi:hypothetical protein